MHDDAELFRAVTSSDLINGEGQPLVWLSRLYGEKLPERVVGCELFENLLPLAHQRGYRVFLFGAREEVVRECVRLASERYSPELIAGWRNGYYAPEEEEGIARQIAASGAQLLFVGMTSPKKELFLHNHREILAPVNFRMGVGGSFDVMAGKVGRAPKLVQKAGLEWFYRWIQEPRAKWKPVVADSFRFLYYLARERISGGAPRTATLK
jgi:N-acetylglucosaminyldiphosphoundecaprenol N-acetyl-beta-D-mannosaminyltransferase